MCLVLRDLALRHGRVVLATLHTPSTAMWHAFTHALVFAGKVGRQAGGRGSIRGDGWVWMSGGQQADLSTSSVGGQGGTCRPAPATSFRMGLLPHPLLVGLWSR